jgi:hypothetical protein
MLAIGGGRLPAALPVLGVGIWLDPALLLATATVGSNPNGACELPLPIGNHPALAGLRLFAQFLWLGPSSPAPCPPLGLSASNALDLVVQP